MQVSRIIAEIDAQIIKLQKARALLAEGLQPERATGRRGRPKGSANTTKASGGRSKRKMTPEGRKRIADAMKKRWAERRKQNAGK
ncbi:hypothetical protein [Edaphobacter sp. 12200R-103]|uniref:hypothetical protein n=1 Tax=Edaphobacter sp. 12200R-103 TaxID=2703788 RepID=UPI00138CF5AD|nr:hypothetical protein [Edaphobacter sp. 12200R-103]QHS51564.1 hypothetical protein GWR55_07255 [Edaphobacter sp. 12200R-103]